MVPKAKTGKKRKTAARSAVAKKKAKALVAKPKAKSGPAKKASASKLSKASPPKTKTAPRATSAPKGHKSRPSAATTSVILASVSSTPAKAEANAVPRKWQKHFRILTDLRDTLLEQSGRLAREAHEEPVSHSMHMADSGTDSFDRDFALSLLSADQNALAEVEFALQRIRTGDYGICEMTGKAIGQDRLEAIPWTRFSYEAQQQLEKIGAGGRVHLGSLRTVHGGDAAEVKDDDDDEEEGKKEAE